MISASALLIGSTVARAQEVAVPPPAPPVKEILRGPYVLADLGAESMLGTEGVTRPCSRVGGCPLLTGQLALGLGIGDDFVDRERLSAAWELRFGEALFNGPTTDDLVAMAALGEISPVEGDVALFTATGTLELSTYPTRRLGLGVRAGGGVGSAPQLMTTGAFGKEVTGRFGDTGGAVHHETLPIAILGVTAEYYTKLAHFSVGTTVDAAYLVGFDVGVTPTGWAKYTF